MPHWLHLWLQHTQHEASLTAIFVFEPSAS